MFEIEDLFEYDLLQEGAFDSLQEFIDWTSGADPETIFGLLKEGSFDSIEEFKKGVNFQRDVDLKKKDFQYRVRDRRKEFVRRGNFVERRKPRKTLQSAR